MKKITKTQKAAIEWLQTSDRLKLHDNVIENFKIHFTDYGVIWVTVDLVPSGAVPGSLLHALGHQHWFIKIGPRGGLTAYDYPDYCDQWSGKRVRHILFKRAAK